MCELLGLCFNKEVSFRLEFSGLKAGAMKNPDGWGVAWYDEYGTQILKESRPAFRSRLAEDFQEHLGAVRESLSRTSAVRLQVRLATSTHILFIGDLIRKPGFLPTMAR